MRYIYAWLQTLHPADPCCKSILRFEYLHQPALQEAGGTSLNGRRRIAMQKKRNILVAALLAGSLAIPGIGFAQTSGGGAGGGGAGGGTTAATTTGGGAGGGTTAATGTGTAGTGVANTGTNGGGSGGWWGLIGLFGLFGLAGRRRATTAVGTGAGTTTRL
jgi:hypothetical protein